MPAMLRRIPNTSNLLSTSQLIFSMLAWVFGTVHIAAIKKEI
jgi:hypothetical protein